MEDWRGQDASGEDEVSFIIWHLSDLTNLSCLCSKSISPVHNNLLWCWYLHHIDEAVGPLDHVEQVLSRVIPDLEVEVVVDIPISTLLIRLWFPSIMLSEFYPGWSLTLKLLLLLLISPSPLQWSGCRSPQPCGASSIQSDPWPWSCCCSRYCWYPHLHHN